MSVPVRIGPSFQRLGAAVELFSTVELRNNPNHRAYDLMPDGETFLFIGWAEGDETRIGIDWVEELRRIPGR